MQNEIYSGMVKIYGGELKMAFDLKQYTLYVIDAMTNKYLHYNVVERLSPYYIKKLWESNCTMEYKLAVTEVWLYYGRKRE